MTIINAKGFFLPTLDRNQRIGWELKGCDFKNYVQGKQSSPQVKQSPAPLTDGHQTNKSPTKRLRDGGIHAFTQVRKVLVGHVGLHDVLNAVVLGIHIKVQQPLLAQCF